MGIKSVSDELVSTVQSVVGFEYSKMDVIRALHMAKNDPTAAINIIFDTPSFKTHGFSRNSEPLRQNSKPKVHNSMSNASNESCNKIEKLSCLNANGDVEGMCEEIGKIEEVKQLDSSGTSSSGSIGNDWWFVGCGELAGLSTCKGRSLDSGEEVLFTFPVERKLSSPSSGKTGSGRGDLLLLVAKS